MTKEILRRVIQIRAGGRVERAHGIPHVLSYNNAAHSWGVAMLVHALWPEDFPRLALHCLAHDVPEEWVGDIPATTKRYAGIKGPVQALEDKLSLDLGLPLDEALDPEDRTKIKNCDHLELWFWSREQINMGNLYAWELVTQLEEFWKETPLLPEAHALWEEAQNNILLPRLAGVIKELVEAP